LLSGNQKIDTVKAVRDWVKFMTATERPPITDVFILLDDKELEAYNSPGLIQAYKDAGMTVHHTPYNAPKSYKTIMEQLDVVFNRSSDNANADAASVVHRRRPRAVVHCTHGMGRSGRVAAGWLVYKYGLNVDDAVDEALAAARLAGVERMGSPQQLTEWIQESRS
jgi:protein-tyrosine phosphatase